MSKWHKHPAYQTWNASQEEARQARRAQIEGYIAYYRDKVAEDRDSPIRHAILGNLLFARGEVNEGLAELREATRLDPDNDSYHYSLARVRFRQGAVEEAIGELRECIRLSVDRQYSFCARYLFELGDVYNTIGRRAEARDAWEKALRRDRTCSMAAELRKRLLKYPLHEAGR